MRTTKPSRRPRTKAIAISRLSLIESIIYTMIERLDYLQTEYSRKPRPTPAEPKKWFGGRRGKNINNLM